MVEADNHLNLLPSSILDMSKMLEHIEMLSMIYSSSLTQLYPHYLAQICGFLVTVVESKCCQYVMVETDSHLKLLSPSILDMHKILEHIDMLFIVKQ